MPDFYPIRNLEDFREACQIVGDGEICLLPQMELHDYFAAHPPSADATLDPESRELIKMLRDILYEAQEYVNSYTPREEPIRLVPDEKFPGDFTTNYPVRSREELTEILRSYNETTQSPRSGFNLWLTRELKEELLLYPECAATLEACRRWKTKEECKASEVSLELFKKIDSLQYRARSSWR